MAGKNLFRFDSNEKQKKIFKASIVFIIAAFLGILIFSLTNSIVNADKTATIEVLVAPSDAIVTIDGKRFPTDAKIKIEPGTYAVKIEKDGFISFNGSIKANDKETSYLYEYLNPTAEDDTYYKDNDQDASRSQKIADTKADLFHESYTGTDNIWNVTPYDDYPSGYKIYAEKDDSGQITINIYLYTCSASRVEKLKQNALDYLEENDINPNNYNLNYSSCS